MKPSVLAASARARCWRVPSAPVPQQGSGRVRTIVSRSDLVYTRAGRPQRRRHPYRQRPDGHAGLDDAGRAEIPDQPRRHPADQQGHAIVFRAQHRLHGGRRIRRPRACRRRRRRVSLRAAQASGCRSTRDRSTSKATGVTARLLAWHERDVIAIEIDDRRAVAGTDSDQPADAALGLAVFRRAMEKMIADRIVTVRTREHTARSQITARDGRILLTQDFQEGAASRSTSAVAIALLGRPNADALRRRNRSAHRLARRARACRDSHRERRHLNAEPGCRGGRAEQPSTPPPQRASTTSPATTPSGGTPSGSAARSSCTAQTASPTTSPRTITTIST